MLGAVLLVLLSQTPAAPPPAAPSAASRKKPHKKTPEELAQERAVVVANAQKLLESQQSKLADFLKHKFPDSKHLLKDSLHREEGQLYALDGAYQRVVAINEPSLSVLALVRDGTAFWHLDVMVLAVPPPPEVVNLGPEGLKAYSDVYALMGSRQFKDRAISLWRRADAISKKTGVGAEAVDSIRDKMK